MTIYALTELRVMWLLSCSCDECLLSTNVWNSGTARTKELEKKKMVDALKINGIEVLDGTESWSRRNIRLRRILVLRISRMQPRKQVQGCSVNGLVWRSIVDEIYSVESFIGDQITPHFDRCH
jgi:hypothetical protein